MHDKLGMTAEEVASCPSGMTQLAGILLSSDLHKGLPGKRIGWRVGAGSFQVFGISIYSAQMGMPALGHLSFHVSTSIISLSRAILGQVEPTIRR
jgi:hypothetical protein